MNIRKLEIFYATATSLNMTKVAKELYISQPSVSQAIHEVENEVGATLFDRIGKRIYLTHEGEVYLNYVRRILNLYKEARESMQIISNNEKGKIKIGASTTIGIYILPHIIRDFVEKHSGIEISLVVENTEHIKELILENKVDFAFVEGLVESDELRVEKMWEDELVFISGESNAWDGKEIIEEESLKGRKLIMREKGSGTRSIVESYLINKDVNFNIFMELGNTEAIKKSVEAKLGIGCVSIRCVKDMIDEGKLKMARFKGEKIMRDLLLIMHKDKFINNNMVEFIEFAYK